MEKQELIEKRMRLLNEADDILKRAKEEGRYELTGDEDKRWNEIHADADKQKAFLDKLDKQEALAEPTGRRSEPSNPQRQYESQRVVGRPSNSDRLEGFRSWFQAGTPEGCTPEQRAVAQRCGINLESKSMRIMLPDTALRADTYASNGRWKASRDSFDEWQTRAAMGTTSGAVGLYTVPDEAMRSLEESLLAFGGMRQVATVIRTSTGAALPIPTSDDTSNKGAIVAENTVTSEVDITFGQLVLDSYKYSSKYVLVSVELLQDSSINVAEFVGRKLGERIGRITNDHFSTGDGNSKPNGIVSAAGSGVTSVADPPTYDNFVDLVHSVDPDYRVGAKFMMADSVLKTVKKIKVLQYSGDTTGVPLWSPSLVAGQPDMILGYPYVINQSMAAPGSSAKKVIFGDLSKYLIRDVRDVTLLRLDERFAEYHQVAFLAFSRHDGDLLDAGTDPVKYMQQS